MLFVIIFVALAEVLSVDSTLYRPTRQTDIGREHTTSTEAASSSSSSVSSDTCYCSFDLTYSLVAYSGGRSLGANIAIRKGETVDLRCRISWMNLVWENGLSLYGSSVRLTCDSCKNWSRSDLPFCRDTQLEDSLLYVSDGTKILPGGIIEISRGQNISFDCRNYFRTPAWYPSDKGGTSVVRCLVDNLDFPGLLKGDKSSFRDGEVFVFKCDPKYEEAKVNRFRCEDGNWIGPIQPCFAGSCLKPVPLVENAKAEVSSRTHLSVVKYVCKEPYVLIETSHVQCLFSEWEGIPPRCAIDMTCPRIITNNPLMVAYTNDVNVNSTAIFHCNSNTRLIGKNTAICMPNREWSNSRPTCKKITCPRINANNSLVVAYTNDIEVNSTATFLCNPSTRLVGENSAICMPNGEWSHSRPTCENITCSRIITNNSLVVAYTNTVEVNSTAIFLCNSNRRLIGEKTANCMPNGEWSNSRPTCEKEPMCSIESLMNSLPKEVSLDVRNISDTHVPFGAELKFHCNTNFFISGFSKIKCGPLGRWEHGVVRCIQGCLLGNITSELLVEPEKEHYFFGEQITFSCPSGQQLSSKVQRVMCLGKTWSNPIPDCEESESEEK